MKAWLLIPFLVFVNNAFSQELSELSKAIKIEKPLQEQKEATVIDFSNIKSVLKEDGLKQHQKEKSKKIQKIIEVKKQIQEAKNSYPAEESLWSFLSELWLVKNAQKLQWDITRPEYGFDQAFKGLLEELGYFKKKFKILIVNSPDITHLGLPANPDEYIFIVSLPFIRTLDLTKVDVTMLLLENFFRLEQKAFIQNFKTDWAKIIATPVEAKSQTEFISKMLSEYTDIIYKSGFAFQQQYEATKAMDSVLKSRPELWSVYLRLINKIDRLVKSNLLYKSYTNIYPSPELQIKWLTPTKPMP